MLSQHVPGALGLALRKTLYPLLLGSCGRNVVFGQNVVLRHPHKIRIGDNVVIDDNCLIDAKGEANRGITIGSGVFIGRNTILSCKNGDIELGDGANVGFNCEIFSASTVTVGRDTLIAAYCYLIGGDHDFSDPSQPIAGAGAALERRDASATARGLARAPRSSTASTIGDRAIVGAGAVVREAVPPGAIAVGVPRADRRAAREWPPFALMVGKLNVLQVCDHLGWEGSRMHGVKRLFAWMIPRFDPERYNVSLVSLRKKDLSEETLESFGVDITYLHKSKFDPATLPALLKVIDRKKIDILHLHGYGATTFGRMAGGDAPAADDPPRAREPDRYAVVPEDRRRARSSR